MREGREGGALAVIEGVGEHHPEPHAEDANDGGARGAGGGVTGPGGATIWGGNPPNKLSAQYHPVAKGSIQYPPR